MTLVRGIRKWDLVLLVLNAIIGAGIFGLPSRVFALSGVYSIAAYVVCAVPVFLIILCFAEVTSRFKDTGGPYLYARQTFGPIVGFEMGWLAWIARLSAFAALCNLFVDYLSYFVPASGAGAGRALVQIVVIGSLAAINFSGVRVSANATNVFTIGKLIPLLIVAIAGAFFIDPARYASGELPTYTAFSSSVLLLFYAFTGFEPAVIPAGETENPRTHLPFALVTGISIVTVLYITIQTVAVGALPGLATSARPLADVGGRIFGSPGAGLVALGAIVSVTGAMNASMLAAPRLLFAMAEHRQLPPIVGATHPQFRTPHVAIVISVVGFLALTLSGTFASAAQLSTIVRLTIYGATCAALPVLRRRPDATPASFKVPAGDVLASAAVILVLWLLSSSSPVEARQAAIAAMVGLLLFLAFARREMRAEAPS
jgi:amino acid transporter